MILLLTVGSTAPAMAQTPINKKTPVVIGVGDIDFGDDSGDWTHDAECDDPRFEGPGAANLLLDSDLKHDGADCQANYEAGTIMLISEAE